MEQLTAYWSRIGPWARKRVRSWSIQVAVALVLALGIRSAIAEEFHATSDAVAPEVPRDARVLVFKMARTFSTGDIIVYREQGKAKFGRVLSAGADEVRFARQGEPDRAIPRAAIVGRVVLSSR